MQVIILYPIILQWARSMIDQLYIVLSLTDCEFSQNKRTLCQCANQFADDTMINIKGPIYRHLELSLNIDCNQCKWDLLVIECCFPSKRCLITY